MSVICGTVSIASLVSAQAPGEHVVEVLRRRAVAALAPLRVDRLAGLRERGRQRGQRGQRNDEQSA
jgi:hypothetical protein